RNLIVAGELANVKHHARSGHVYFTLKDRDAQIRGVMFQINVHRLDFRPADGIEVIVHGGVSMYEARGEVQLYAEFIEPRGKGAAHIAIERLAAKLKAEGLFERSRKRKLPWLPRGVGIVTSLNGAALRDMLKVLRRRFPGMPVVVAQTSVQGETAPWELINAIRAINRYAATRTLASDPPIDVLIVGRGGGSYEDLHAFNEEHVARAIVASALPVLSAVGHETDLTIADLVADRRALSPSEGAELVVPPRAELTDRLRRIEQRLRAAIGRHARRATDVLARHEHRLTLLHPARRLRELSRRADQVGDGLDAAMRDRLDALRHRLDTARGRLQRAIDQRLQSARTRLPYLEARLVALSPDRVLERGYSLTLDDAGRPIVDASQVAPGAQIVTRLHRGRVASRVERVDPPPA
ncbi:MAG: exodeoxyribonuclease VII large subunit, partial [Planctomycetota bacterium]